MIHTIALLGASEFSDGWIAADAACTYVFTAIPSQQSPFILYSPRPLNHYSGYNSTSRSFIVGDYSIDRLSLPAPPGHLVNVQWNPSKLKNDYLITIKNTLKSMKPADTLFLPIHSHGNSLSGGVHIGERESGVEITPREVTDFIWRSTSMQRVILWNNSCYSDHWIGEGFPWKGLAAAEKDKESHSFRESPSGYNRGGVHTYGVIATLAKEVGIALPLTNFHREGAYVEERPPRPHSFSTTNLPRLGEHSCIGNLCAMAEAANIVAGAQPALYTARALASPETQWRFPAPSLNYQALQMLRLVHYQAPPPTWADSNSRIATAGKSWPFVEKFIHLVEILPVGRHPREYLIDSLRRTFLPSSDLLNPPVLTCCVRTATDVNDIDVVGDILTHRLDCFITVYLFCRYGSQQPIQLPQQEENVEGLYWDWMREARNSPDLLRDFLDSTSTNLADLLSVSGAHADFCGVPVNWMPAVSWLAAKWDQAGRPDFSLSTLMFYRLWRVINLKPKIIPLAPLVLNWLDPRSPLIASQSDFQLSSKSNGELATAMPALRRQASTVF